MGTMLQFSNEKHQIAFEDLSKEHKDRVAAIVKHDNDSQKAAKELGVSWSSFDRATAKIFRQKFNATKLEVFPFLYKHKKQQNKSLASKLMELITKQEFRCALTGVKITPENAVVDHIEPIANGGDHSIENLQWVHKEVNRMKGSMEQSEFIDICRKVSQWTA